MKRREPGLEPGQEDLFDVSAYSKVRLVGSGGYGVVLEAIHRLSGQTVALKTVEVSDAEDSPKRQRMLRGTRLLAGLPRHPNVVPIYTAGFGEAGFVQVMEFVKGETLRSLIAGEGCVPWQRATQIMDGILAGVAHSHQHGIVHRDLKPRNVILDSEDGGRPRLIDFDLARPPEVSMQLTRPGLVVGTAHYLAPELLRKGRGSGGPEGDVFALGVILYEMLAGERPFRGKETFDVMQTILDGKPTPLSEVVPDLPPGLSDFVMQALSKSSRRRFKDAAAMREALQRILAGKSRGRRRRDRSPRRSGRRSRGRSTSRRFRAPGVEFSLGKILLVSSLLVLPLAGLLLG